MEKQELHEMNQIQLFEHLIVTCAYEPDEAFQRIKVEIGQCIGESFRITTEALFGRKSRSWLAEEMERSIQHAPSKATIARTHNGSHLPNSKNIEAYKVMFEQAREKKEKNMRRDLMVKGIRDDLLNNQVSVKLDQIDTSIHDTLQKMRVGDKWNGPGQKKPELKYDKTLLPFTVEVVTTLIEKHQQFAMGTLESNMNTEKPSENQTGSVDNLPHIVDLDSNIIEGKWTGFYLCPSIDEKKAIVKEIVSYKAKDNGRFVFSTEADIGFDGVPDGVPPEELQWCDIGEGEVVENIVYAKSEVDGWEKPYGTCFIQMKFSRMNDWLEGYYTWLDIDTDKIESSFAINIRNGSRYFSGYIQLAEARIREELARYN